MKFLKISALLNQGITELFENITSDIIYKMNDEDLINRTRSIKLGYNNIALFKNDDKNFYDCEINTGNNSRNSANYYNKQNDNFDKFSNCCKIV